MNSSKCGNYKHGDVFPTKDHPLGGIKIHMYKREPHGKVSQANEGEYLIMFIKLTSVLLTHNNRDGLCSSKFIKYKFSERGFSI